MIGTGDVHEFPELEDKIGENPAVFLTKISKEDVALCVIKGIETGERARFETVEDRREWLASIEVERVDETEDEDEEIILWRHTKEECRSLDVDQESGMAWYCHACDQRTNRVEEVDPDAISLDELPDAQAQIGKVRRAIADGGSRRGSE